MSMTHCGKQIGSCCDCAEALPLDLSIRLNHWLANFEFQGWRLRYGTLAVPGEDTCLCEYGRCRICGKCLCLAFGFPVGQSTDGFLATIYRVMFYRWGAEQPSFVSIRKMFVSIFHEEDQPVVLNWISLPKNQHIGQMYRHDV